MFTIVFKVKLIKNNEQWCVVISATRHVCIKKKMFSTYTEQDCEPLYIRNSSTSKVIGVQKIILKMTSENLLTLNNVLHCY
jgi:hypothetical protein